MTVEINKYRARGREISPDGTLESIRFFFFSFFGDELGRFWGLESIDRRDAVTRILLDLEIYDLRSPFEIESKKEEREREKKK